MSVTESRYYGLTKVREQGPEAKDWATVDRNFEVISLILKAIEQQAHTGAQGIRYPGYDPTTPILPTITEQSTGGVLTPGASVGVRLSYIDGAGLETAGSGEVVLTLSGATTRPLTPILLATTQLTGAIPGGTYVYALTKVKGTGETPVSDVLQVTIPYDNTYSVQIQFDSISSYSPAEGVTALNIYRSAGLSSGFQLVTSITDTAATTFTDTNSIPPGNVGIQPPTNNTFDASRSVRIDWSSITHPTDAHTLRVYLTRQAGLWSTDHLLTEVDLTSAPANYINYLGSETLGTGWPLNNSEIVDSPPKVNLATEATGGLNLTADSNFNGHLSTNFVLGNTSQSIEGALWFDTSNKTYKGYANSQQITLSPPQVFKNWIKNPSAETNTNFVSAGGSWGTTTTSNTRSTIGAYSFSNSVSSFATSATEDFSFVSGTTLAQLQADAMAVNGGNVIYVAADVYLTNTASSTVGQTLTLFIDLYSATGTLMSSYSAGTSNPVSHTGDPANVNLATNQWQRIGGWATADPGATWAVLRLRLANGSTVYTTQTVNVDKVIMVKVANNTTVVPYFDGDSIGAQWSGTAHNSPSISGYFQHGIEEAGGHRAENIWFPTAASGVNVATVLSRIADATTGLRIPVQGLIRVPGTTSNPTPITSTAPVSVPELTTTFTPQFSGQWIRVYAKILMSVTFPTGTTSATITMDCTTTGAVLTNAEYTQTAVVSGQTITLTGEWWYQAPNTVAEQVNIRAYVSAGASAQPVGTNRVLIVQQTF